MAGRLIKFPLKMKSGAEIRTIEELRECSEPETLIEYYLNGVLVRWLKAFHYDEEAENISKLDNETCKKLFEILHIDVSEEKLSSVNVDEIKGNMEKKEAETKTSSEIPELNTAKEELKKKVDNMSEDEICDECINIIEGFIKSGSILHYNNINEFDPSDVIYGTIPPISIYKEKRRTCFTNDEQIQIHNAMKNIIINQLSIDEVIKNSLIICRFN